MKIPEKQNPPAIRFPGFNKPWVFKKLKSVILKRTSSEVDDIPLYSLTIEDGVVPKSERYDREHLVSDSDDAYVRVEHQDFVYNPMNLRFGALKQHTDPFPVKVSKYYDIFFADSSVNRDFLYYNLTRDAAFAFYDRMSTGSLVEKRRVHFGDFLKFEFPFPERGEQDKIAQFLQEITRIQETLKERVRLLGMYKTACMQELIITPEGMKKCASTTTWPEKKLGDVFSERSERGNPDAELLSVTLRNGVVRASDVSRATSASANRSNYKYVRVGDIAYNSMRMWQGASGVSTFEGIVSPAYTVLAPKSDTDSNYWGHYFKHPRVIHTFQRYSQGLTSDTWNLKFPAISQIRVVEPPIEEQRKIASFLSQVDVCISDANQQLEDIVVFKKGLLQQMFV